MYATRRRWPCSSSGAATTAVRNTWELAENRFDLARLDPKASNLDLVVESTDELDVAVGAIAGEIAGAV